MTVRKRGSRWWYDFRLRGIRYHEPIPEAQTKAEALQAEAKIRSDLFGGRTVGRVQLFLSTYWPLDRNPLEPFSLLIFFRVSRLFSAPESYASRVSGEA